MEEWRTIVNFPEYKVSTLGRVYSQKSNKILKELPTKKGYYHVRLYNEEYPKGKRFSINRLVFLAFGQNQEQFTSMEVDHISRDKSDNSINNLRLLPTKENCQNRGKNKTSQGIKPSSNFKGVSLKKKKVLKKWTPRLRECGELFQFNYYKHEVNAAYVWYYVAKHFRDIMGDNEAFLNAELPDEDEDRDEEVRRGIEKVKRKLYSKQ